MDFDLFSRDEQLQRVNERLATIDQEIGAIRTAGDAELAPIIERTNAQVAGLEQRRVDLATRKTELEAQSAPPPVEAPTPETPASPEVEV